MKRRLSLTTLMPTLFSPKLQMEIGAQCMYQAQDLALQSWLLCLVGFNLSLPQIASLPAAFPAQHTLPAGKEGSSCCSLGSTGISSSQLPPPKNQPPSHPWAPQNHLPAAAGLLQWNSWRCEQLLLHLKYQYSNSKTFFVGQAGPLRLEHLTMCPTKPSPNHHLQHHYNNPAASCSLIWKATRAISLGISDNILQTSWASSIYRTRMPAPSCLPLPGRDKS